jgi:PleD family two-component response regulator
MSRASNRTISASASAEVAERVLQTAKLEDRTPSQVVAAAADLYTRLSPEAHIALRRIELLGGAAALERVLAAISRDILRHQFDAARQAGAAAMRVAEGDPAPSDDDLLEAASAAVARAGTRSRRRAG